MTTINDISDLVNVLQEHPEWRHTIRGLVIGEELAQVPQRLTELENRIESTLDAKLSAYIESNDRTVQLLRESQAEADRRLTAHIESNDRTAQLLRESQAEADRRLTAHIESNDRTIQLLQENQAEADRRLTAHIESNDRTIQELREGQRRLEESQAELDRKFVAHMESNDRNIQLLQESQAELDRKFVAHMESNDRNIQLLRENQAELDRKFNAYMESNDRTVQELREGQRRLEEGLAETNRTLAAFMKSTEENFRLINGRLDNGFGMNYQYKVEKNIRSIATQHLGLRRIRILRDYGTGYAANFLELIEKADEEGALSESQIVQLWQIDLAFSGRDREGNIRHIAAELSISIARRDVLRARERAMLMKSLLDEGVTPVVIGDRIHDTTREFADNEGVTVVLHPDN